jgi:hypothetical protein
MEPKRSESISRTRVLSNPSQISGQIRHITETYSDLSIASTFGGQDQRRDKQENRFIIAIV